MSPQTDCKSTLCQWFPQRRQFTVLTSHLSGVWKFLSFCGRCDQRICRITNDSLCCLTCLFLKLWWQLFKQIFYTKVWTLLFWSAHFKAHFWRRDVKWIIENSLFLWTMYQSRENKCDSCLWVAFYLKSQKWVCSLYRCVFRSWAPQPISASQ